MPTAERALLHRGGRRGTWGSLGLWHEGGEDYGLACEALAHAVGTAAGLQRGDSVLSIGCGAGDELLLWARAFGAAEVWGLERDPQLVGAARHLLERSPLPASTQAQVLLGDAGLRSLHKLPRRHFDRIVCVDAAYHLSPRRAFLDAAQALLRPGGRLALTDLSRRPPGPGGRGWAWAGLLHGAAWLTRAPLADIVPLSAQVQRLQAAGFSNVQSVALDAAVLDGFARHVRRQGPRIARTLLHPDWRRPGLTAALIGPCRAAGLGYTLLSGEATPSAAATPSAERTALSSKGTPLSA